MTICIDEGHSMRRLKTKSHPFCLIYYILVEVKMDFLQLDTHSQGSLHLVLSCTVNQLNALV